MNLEESFGWYDISVTVASDAGFLRRLSGHVENGEASFSDPAIGGTASRTSDNDEHDADVEGG
jgi:phospholipase C